MAWDPPGKCDSVVRFGYGIYHIMQGTGLAETSNPNGLVTLTFPWNDTNGDTIPQLNERLPANATPVGSSGGAQINRNMSRPYFGRNQRWL